MSDAESLRLVPDAMNAQPRIVVTAAVIRRGGMFLVTRRPAEVHLGGYWEFPGGKCEAGESLASCLAREILEELDAQVHVGNEMLVTEHTYPERTVELHFMECELRSEPRPLMGQEMRWVSRQELRDLKFPPADDELLALLE